MRDDALVHDPALRLEKISAETSEGAVLITTGVVTGCATRKELREELSILLDQYAAHRQRALSAEEREAAVEFITDFMAHLLSGSVGEPHGRSK